MAIFLMLALPLLKTGKQGQTGGRSGGRVPDDTAHQTRLQFQPPVWAFSPCRLAQVLGSATRVCRRLRTREPFTFTSVTAPPRFA